MDQTCSATLDGNTFSNNKAIEGGAIYYDLYRPTESTSNVFTGNDADYGTDFASFPSYLEFPDVSKLTGIASG